MGASASTNVAKTTANVISKITNSVIQNESVDISSSQILSVIDVIGDVEISNNTITTVISVDMKSVLESLSQDEVKQNLALEMAQAAKALVSDITIGQVSVSMNTLDTVIQETIDIATQLSQTCSSVAATNQTISVQHVVGNLVIDNNHLKSIQSLIEDCSIKALNNSSTVQGLQQELNESSDSTTKGISIWGLAVVGVIVVAGLFVVFVGPALIPVLVAGNNPSILGFFVLLVGAVFLVVYWLWTSKKFKSSLWVNSISKTCQPAITLSGIAKASDADEAARRCVQNKKCRGYDFISYSRTDRGWVENATTDTAYYSSIASPCKLASDEAPILRNRAVYYARSNYSDAYRATYPNGSIWFNTSDFSWQEYNQPKDRWSLPKKVPGVDFISKIDITGAVEKDALEHNTGGWALRADPSLYTLYFSKISRDGIAVNGPGMTVTPDVHPNVSGMYYDVRRDWALYTGLGFVCAGLLLMIFLKSSSSKTPKEKKNKNVSITRVV